MRQLLSRLEKVYRAINFATGALLGASSWEDRVEEVLARLGAATGASGVYVFESQQGEEGQLVGVLRHEWAGPGFGTQKDNPKLTKVRARAEGFGQWLDALRSGTPIYGHAQDFPGCRDFLAAAGLADVASIAAVPVFAGGEYWGAIGFHQRGETREWAAIEIEALRSAALVLGGAIHRQRTQAAAQESEERWRLLAENVPDIIMTVSREGTILALNRTVPGITLEEAVGRKVYEYVSPDRRDVVRGALERAFRTQEPGAFEIVGAGPHGADAWYETRVVPIRRDGQVIAATLISTDISERKRSAQALAESEARYRDLFENSVVGIYRTTPDGRVLTANPALVRMLGYATFEELAQRNLEEEGFEPEYERSVFRERIERDGQVTGLESAWTKRDGTRLFVRENARLVRDEKGRVLCYEGTAEDITDRKRAQEELSRHRDHLEELVAERTAELRRANQSLQREIHERELAEEALRESEQRHRDLAELLPQTVYEIDENTKLTFANRHAFAAFGYSLEDFVRGLRAAEMLIPEDRQRAGENLGRVLRGEQSQGNEYTALRKDGTTFPIMIFSAPIFRRGRPAGARGIIVDLTERKQAEEALRESEEKYRQLFATVSDAITMFDAETKRFVDVNDAAVKLYGYSREEFLKLRHADIIDDPQRSDASIRGALADETGRSLVRCHRKRDGTIFPVEISASKFALGNRTVLFGVIRDITERMRAEEALRESEARYRAVVEHIPAITYTTAVGKTSRTAYLSPQAERLLGFRIEDYAAAHETWRSALHPEDRARVLAELARTRSTGQPFLCEYRMIASDGRVLWFRDQASLVHDDQGRPLFLQGVMFDITDRKHAENALRESEERFRLLLAHAYDGINLCERPPYGPDEASGTGRKLVFCNDRFVAMSGRSRDDLMDRDDINPLVISHLTDEERAENTRSLWQGRPSRGVSSWLRPDGRENYHEWVAVPLRIGGRLYTLGIDRDITERRRAEQALRAARRKLMTAREEECRRLARELHDSVSQRIIAMYLRLRNLCAALPPSKQTPLAKALEEAARQNSELIQEVRQISHGLYPLTLEQLGLCSALEQLVKDCQAQNVQMAARYDPAVQNARFAGDVEIAVFRTAQEAIHNILRHAEAEHAELVLRYEEGHVILHVVDDGVGFDPASSPKGLGLSSMQDRARALDGRLEISSQPGRTCVAVQIPAQPLPPEPQGEEGRTG